MERGRVDPWSAEAQQLFAQEMVVIRTKWKGSTTAGGEVEAAYKKRAGITTSVFGLTVERGFVSAVSGRISDFVQTGAEICAVEPVETLGLYWEGGTGLREKPGDLERLAAMSILARMKELTEEKRFALAAALLFRQLAQAHDDGADMLIRQVQRIHYKAKELMKLRQASHLQQSAELVSTLRDVTIAYQQEGTAEQRLQISELFLDQIPLTFWSAVKNMRP